MTEPESLSGVRRQHINSFATSKQQLQHGKHCLCSNFYTGTNLYCLATEAHECKQLVEGCCLTAWRPGLKLATTESWVQLYEWVNRNL